MKIDNPYPQYYIDQFQTERVFIHQTYPWCLSVFDSKIKACLACAFEGRTTVRYKSRR